MLLMTYVPLQVALVFLLAVVANACAQFAVSFGAPGLHSPYAYSSSARVQTSRDALIAPIAYY
jgi:hypothetical protein